MRAAASSRPTSASPCSARSSTRSVPSCPQTLMRPGAMATGKIRHPHRCSPTSLLRYRRPRRRWPVRGADRVRLGGLTDSGRQQRVTPPQLPIGRRARERTGSFPGFRFWRRPRMMTPSPGPSRPALVQADSELGPSWPSRAPATARHVTSSATIAFRTTPGKAGSTSAWFVGGLSEITDIDKGETHGIPDAMGRATFTNVVPRSFVDVASGTNPELIGTISVVFESDATPFSAMSAQMRRRSRPSSRPPPRTSRTRRRRTHCRVWGCGSARGATPTT